ncbi:hypothetical protein [Bacterioplanoides pacificum]|uniref:Lysozyme inhibitor LprI N-terminal domain-containing protein n=1 Tax=Bacterioplanoides pacificum TaxID=1171596 RepID=A0ABV7VU83_9GAMM
MRSALAVLLTCIGLAGCSSNPLSPTGEAIYYALQTDTSLRSWVDACTGVSSEAKQQALMTQKNWWKRNGAFVESADFGLAYDLVTVTDERAETGARLAMALTWQVVETAEQEVQELMQNTSDREQLCRGIMTQYSEGERDLRGNESLYNNLVALQRRSQSQGKELALKKASVEQRTGRVYGRSFYVVEKMARRQGCPGAEVQLLKNAWPHEVYDARCPDGSYLIARCEWGNCLIAE